MIPIPDFESEQGIITTKPNPVFEINDTMKHFSKRKKGPTDSSDVDRSGICCEVCGIKWETRTLQGVYSLVKTFGKGTNLPLPLS